MRSSPVILVLAVSLALNLALATHLIRTPAATSTGPLLSASPSSPRQRPLPQQGPANPEQAPPVPPLRVEWRWLVEHNYVDFVSALRRLAWPETAIRNAVIGSIDEEFEARRRALPEPAAFWRTGSQRLQERRRQQAELMNLETERLRRIQEALGYDARWHWQFPRDHHLESEVGFVLGFLSDTKPQVIMATVERAQELARQVKELAGGVLGREDIRQLQQLRGELMERWRSVLTPAELEELQLRVQAFRVVDVWSIEDQFGVNLTGAEFREFLRLRHDPKDPLDEILQLPEPLPTEPTAEGLAAENTQLRRLLGDERFQAYSRAVDPEYKALKGLANKLELPVENANAAFALVRETQSGMATLSEEPNLSETDRASALRQLRTQAEDQLRLLLGEAGLKAYRHRHGGWMDEGDKP